MRRKMKKSDFFIDINNTNQKDYDHSKKNILQYCNENDLKFAKID